MRWMQVAVMAALLGSAGCYEYHSVRPADVALDGRVRATVAPNRAAELAPVLRSNTPTVSGKLIERDAEHILLSVPIYGAGGAVGSQVLHNRIRIPTADLVSLESRTLSGWRTGVAIGAVLAAAGATWAVLSAENETGTDKPGTGIDNAILTIFRVPLSVFR
jgi:Mg/Co/Ni transporter MgtE